MNTRLLKLIIDSELSKVEPNPVVDLVAYRIFCRVLETLVTPDTTNTVSKPLKNNTNYYSARKLIKFTCQVCNKEGTGRDKRQKYCSPVGNEKLSQCQRIKMKSQAQTWYFDKKKLQNKFKTSKYEGINSEATKNTSISQGEQQGDLQGGESTPWFEAPEQLPTNN